MHGTYQQTETVISTSSRDPWKERWVAKFFSRLEHGTLTVQFPSGAQRTFVGRQGGLDFDDHAVLFIHDWKTIARSIQHASIGMAEAYIDEQWSSPDLATLLLLFERNEQALLRGIPNTRFSWLMDRVAHLKNQNSREGSRRNISFHYDLGNEFYALWLDESMTYSAALFEQPGMSIYYAQQAKYRRLAEKIGIKPGDQVLEIGCGWGGFAEFSIVELGCHVTGITLSQEQLDFAKKRLTSAGLADKADLRLCDYRDIEGVFDHVISVEMLEAVGEQYWPQYFDRIRSLLKPGGRAGIQVITIEEDRYDRYRRGVDFIQKYIFPGGMLPSDAIFKSQVDRAGLQLLDQHDFGQCYGKTLKNWGQRFHSKLPEVKSMGFDDRFIRLWQFYLSYCEAGFRQGSVNVSHYVVGR